MRIKEEVKRKEGERRRKRLFDGSEADSRRDCTAENNNTAASVRLHKTATQLSTLPFRPVPQENSTFIFLLPLNGTHPATVKSFI